MRPGCVGKRNSMFGIKLLKILEHASSIFSLFFQHRSVGMGQQFVFLHIESRVQLHIFNL